MSRRCIRMLGLVVALGVAGAAAPAAAGRRSTRCCVRLDPEIGTGVRHYCFVVRTARRSALGARAVCRLIGGTPKRGAR